ncbi:glycosyltransferase family 1 protein [Vibrio sp. SNU_ST1]|uniref:glycosyltransferase family 4 protein n=1 Tax=Vibrio sp. SNU_ST1 TaxID=3064001 RepID=UPI00272CB947|nr:glycosyltransferase family 1 protein [Vibrio sp. SNU_ST1]WKY58261.1 glycosyltransferase family 1 protein [Vibrio sp. SNU_ST1]
MKILIDLQSCQSPSRLRGIGRYSLDLALELISIGSDKHDFHILLNSNLSESILSLRTVFEPIIGCGNIHTFSGLPRTSGLENNIELIRATEKIREYEINLINPDFVHVSSLFEGFDNNSVVSIPEINSIPTAVTVYDLIPLVNEKEYLKIPQHKAWYYEKVEQLKRADLLFAISDSTKRECSEYLKLGNEKLSNISSSVSHTFLNAKLSEASSDEVLDKFNIFGNYLLYTANLDKRKNIAGLLEAYSLLDKEIRSSFKLVIVSYIDEERKATLNKKANRLGILQDEWTVTGHVKDEELAVLYNRCSLFVFPSLHEGFGLPCLEAMVCGAPVIGSNVTSIPEVIGLESALFDPLNSLEMAKVITKAITDSEFNQLLLNNSKKRVKEFSWTTTAERFLQEIESFTLPDKAYISKEELYQQCIEGVSTPAVLSDNDLCNIASAIDQSAPKSQPELLIDITALAESDAKTGIQRVVKSIIGQMCGLKLSHQMRLIYLASDGNYYYACDYENKYEHIKSVNQGYVQPHSGDVFVGLDLVAHAAERTGQIYKKWREIGVYICIVVYDILPITMPTFFHSGIRNAFPLWGKMISERSDLLLCISESVAHELEEFIRSSSVVRELPYTIEHFHLGADFSASPSEDTQLEVEEEGLKGIDLSKTFLMVGTIEPRKGHQQVVDAFERLSGSFEDYTLLIVGRVGWNTESLIKKLELANLQASNIKWLSDCADETLQYLYKNARALIAASYGEGFGLPLIEAAQYGIPIIARDIPVFREVAGQHAYFFEDSIEFEVVKDAVINWSNLYDADKHPVSIGMPWLTWEESALQFQSKLMRTSPITYSLPDVDVDGENEAPQLNMELLTEIMPDVKLKNTLFLDISSLVHFDHATGIQRVVRAICDVLLKENLESYDCQVAFSYPGDNNYYYPNIANGNFSVPDINTQNSNVIEFKDGDILVFLDLHPDNGFSKKHLIQQLKQKNVKSYFVVYDLLPISHPNYFVLELVSSFNQWLEAVISSDGALCISEDVSIKLSEWIDENSKLTPDYFENKHFHLGANLDDTVPSVGIPSYASYIESLCDTMETFLMVGTVEPRKAHGLVLDAFEKLWESGSDIALIIVGKAGWCNDVTLQRLKGHKQLNKRLFWLEGISDEYLDMLYQDASCLIAASEGEGFGLPLIESAMHKTPIIARDIQVFREVAGEHAYYFSEDDNPIHLELAIKSWLSLYERDEHPKSDNMPYLTWKESSMQLLECLTINVN